MPLTVRQAIRLTKKMGGRFIDMAPSMISMQMQQEKSFPSRDIQVIFPQALSDLLSKSLGYFRH